MSLHMSTEKARLSVLGTGWSNTAIDSGDGFTIDGQLWDDIAFTLDYEIGKDVDWDLIADNEEDIDWSEIIYTDPDGIIYTDSDGDGIWTDPTTGLEYQNNGVALVPENMLIDFSDTLDSIATSDSSLGQYSIPNDVLSTLYGGKVGTEIGCLYPDDPARPHYYSPSIWYIQQSSSGGIIFLDEPFFHGTADGGSIEVFDEAVTIRDGSSKTVYWSDCTTHFSDNYLPSPYSSYPIQYVCWQCLYGSLSDAIISKKDSTITSDDIKKGTARLKSIVYKNKTYYMSKLGFLT